MCAQQQINQYQAQVDQYVAKVDDFVAELQHFSERKIIMAILISIFSIITILVIGLYAVVYEA